MVEASQVLRMLGCQVFRYWVDWMSGMLCSGMVGVRDARDIGMLGLLNIRKGC